MRVYVDEAVHRYGQMIMCHMVSPDLEALHAMADAIGVRRCWFQDPRTMGVSAPHYDIAKSKRALALRLGAQTVDRYQMAVISKVALFRMPGFEKLAGLDPLAMLRGRDGRPPHRELARIEAWLAGELAALSAPPGLAPAPPSLGVGEIASRQACNTQEPGPLFQAAGAAHG